MTVTYTAEVATCRGFGCFLKLLFRWRGSIYKLVWPDLSFFLFLYYTLNLTYRLALDEDQKRVFESVVLYCEAYSDLIPLSFVLGFYISIIMQRWWDQYSSIPWPDPIAVFVSSHIHGQDERGRLMRRTIMRYVCVCLTMVFTMVSPRVKMRFPTLDHFVEAGLLLDNEKVIIQDLNEKFPRHSKHWLPIVWASSVVTRARREGRIRDDYASKTIIDELNKFRGQCGLLLNYDSISVPLVYTQVVTLAVYSYFVTSVMGRQWLETNGSGESLVGAAKHRSKIDLYFPFFLTLQFFFYMGWLKVAESLINPFGEDDDDFEVNWIVDRNIQVSYLIVDEMHHEHPELIKDQYWDEVLPQELPYTVASEPFREEHPEASTAKIEVPAAGTGLSYNSTLKLDEMGMGDHTARGPGFAFTSTMKLDDVDESDTAHLNDDAASGIHFMAKGSGSRPHSHYDRTNSMASNTSINTNTGLSSMAGSLNRVPSVTSVLKRLFSKEPPSSPQFPMSTMDGNATTPLVGPTNIVTGPGGTTFRHSVSGSSLNLPKTTGGSVRITDQVIEEVDEQATVTSMRRPDPHPSVRTIFANPLPANPSAMEEGHGFVDIPTITSGGGDYRPPASAPMNVPYAPQQAELRCGGDQPRFSDTFTEMLATSSKSGQGISPGSPSLSHIGSRLSVAGSAYSVLPGGQDLDTLSVGSQTDLGDVDDPGDDEFTKLKRQRQRQQRQRLARSISSQQAVVEALALASARQSDASMADTEVQFMDESGSSQVGLLAPSDSARNT